MVIKNKMYYHLVLTVIFFAFFASACNTDADDYSLEISHVDEIMKDMPESGAICISQTGNSSFGDNVITFEDDKYNYFYDKSGYIAAAVLSTKHMTDAYDKYDQDAPIWEESEIDNIKNKTINMHLINISKWKSTDRSVEISRGGMGEYIFTIREMDDGVPIGVSSSYMYSPDGTLINFSAYCKPINEETTNSKIKKEDAVKIAYLELLAEYIQKGKVMPVDLCDLNYETERHSYDAKSVWAVSITEIRRIDPNQDNVTYEWSLTYYIDTENGEIVLELAAA